VRGRIRADDYLKGMAIERLGPLVELHFMGKAKLLTTSSIPRCALLAALDEELSSGLGHGTFVNQHDRNVGFIVTNRNALDASDSLRWTSFRQKAQRAAERWMPKAIAQGLVGAVTELEENIHLHSGCAREGLVAFRATDHEFEIIIGDGGIGILASLRSSPDFAYLRNGESDKALDMALSDGVSRLSYMEPDHGYGFRNLFRNLASINGELRFRSDDYAATATGVGPELVQREIRQKPQFKGFVSSIVCKARPA
jgi:hypothetical protein